MRQTSVSSRRAWLFAGGPYSEIEQVTGTTDLSPGSDTSCYADGSIYGLWETSNSGEASATLP